MTGRRERVLVRLDRLQPLDTLMLLLYIGLGVWGTWAQIEPPLSLLGSSGALLTRIVTLAVLVFAIASAVGILIDTRYGSENDRVDIELPALFGLIGSWLIYVGTIWALVAGHGRPGAPPTIAISGVLVTVFLVPFIVRAVVLIRDGIRMIRKAKLAREVGIVGSDGPTL